MREIDLALSDGRTLHVYDAGPDDSECLAVFWHHGTPNIGAPPEPLFPAAGRLGIGGAVDDNLAYVAPWGFDPGQIRTPVLYLQGGQDRIVPSSHARWLAGHTPSAELWLRPGDGHVSVLGAAESAMGWLMEQAGQR